MKTHQIYVSGAGERADEIRNGLFAFSEVLDVFVTGRPDVLVVIYVGRPRPGEWLHALRRLGYHTPARERAMWPRPQGRSAGLLREVVPSGDVGIDDGRQTTSSIPRDPAAHHGRDAACSRGRWVAPAPDGRGMPEALGPRVPSLRGQPASRRPRARGS